MIFLPIQVFLKPDRTLPESQKDDLYHLNYGRWIIGDGMDMRHYNHLKNYYRNLQYYKSNQWIDEEDVEAFFKDDAGNDRHRIQVVRNYIQPMVEQYRGNAIRMSFDMKATSISPMAKSRRDDILYKMLAYNDVAKARPDFKEYLKKQGYLTGDTDEEVMNRFDNIYVDQFAIAINRLIGYSKSVNNMEKYKKVLARDIACGGLGIIAPYPYNGQWMARYVPVERFGWDRDALEADLSDCGYFFEYRKENASTVFEQYALPLDAVKRIEEIIIKRAFIRIESQQYFTKGRVPIYRTVWRDFVTRKYGYVLDEFNQPILVPIDFVYENEVKPRYKMSNVLPVNKLNEYQKKVLKGNDTYNITVDQWRYADFIPRELLYGKLNIDRLPADGKPRLDVMLQFGKLEYQEPDLYSPLNMSSPYKVGTWSYNEGEVLSPVDVAINPQRMINRFLSVMEQQINNAGGSGPVYDLDVVGTDREDDVSIRMKRGEPVAIHARGRGVQNAVSRYDSGIKESTLVFANLIDNFKTGIEQITGVNEGLKGSAGQNPDQLVGTMQLMIQRGSIIQEPFYSAMTDIFHGFYQSVATSGKRYYVDVDADLVDAIGSDSADVLKLSKDIKLENFRIDIKPSIEPQAERMLVDQKLDQWVNPQFPLIDGVTYSKLYGRATLEEALLELRMYQKRLLEQKRMAEQDNQAIQEAKGQQQQAQGEALRAEQLRQEGRQDSNAQADRAAKIANTLVSKNPNIIQPGQGVEQPPGQVVPTGVPSGG